MKNFGNRNTIGDFNTLGNYNTLGNDNTLGDRNILGNFTTIGDGIRVGKRFSCEGVRVIDFFTMANVDGNGRKIHIYIHTDGILIRAGCFKGNLDEFCDKASEEGKNKYALVVRAAAEAMQKALLDSGETGGWDL